MNGVNCTSKISDDSVLSDLGAGVHVYICLWTKNNNLNRTLAIDSHFQTFVVGLLIDLDLLYHCFLQKRFLCQVNQGFLPHTRSASGVK